jgi:hypothetical protein
MIGPVHGTGFQGRHGYASRASTENKCAIMPSLRPARSRWDALSENDALSGDEIVLLIEALDKLIPFPEDTAHAEKAELRFVWMSVSSISRRSSLIDGVPGCL